MLAFGRLQQDGAVRTRVRLVKGGDERAIKRSGKRTVCAIVWRLNTNASVVEQVRPLNDLYDTEAFVFSAEIGPFVNYPG
jgi:hypothetical protein